MKIDKNIMKKMLIILLVVFIIVPIILMLFGMNNSVTEGFYSFEKTDEEMGKVFNALDVAGLDVSGADGQNISGVEGDYMYCVFGDIECVDGYDISNQDVSINDVNVKKYQCLHETDKTHDPTKAICGSSLFDNGNKAFYLLDASNCFDSNNTQQYNFGSIKQQYNGVNEISGNLDSFTSVYSNTLPFELFDNSGNSDYTSNASTVKFNKPKNETGFTGQNLLGNENDLKYSTCFFYNSYGKCETLGSCPETSTTGEESTTNNETKITCNAHYGQKVGDSLCCGQTGVVQNDSRICPYDYPTCTGYKCGESWGTCSAE